MNKTLYLLRMNAEQPEPADRPSHHAVYGAPYQYAHSEADRLDNRQSGNVACEREEETNSKKLKR